MRQLIKFSIGTVAKSVSFVISRLPQGARDTIGDFIGFLWFDVLQVRRQIAVENVGVAFPQLSLSDKTKIARASVHHMGRTIVDFTLFPFFNRNDVGRYFVIEGLANVEEALKLGKGVILLTCHLGNGDFALAMLSRLGFPINLISKEFKARWLNDLWFGMRRKHGTRFISAEKSSFEILKALRRNELVVFVLDQFMGPPVGVRTTFFGKETGTAAGCALIASRTESPVIPCYTYRREDGKQIMVFEPPIPYQGVETGPAAGAEPAVGRAADKSLREKNIAVMTQVYTDKIETLVQKHPEQWMWIHRRWKEFRD